MDQLEGTDLAAVRPVAYHHVAGCRGAAAGPGAAGPGAGRGRVAATAGGAALPDGAVLAAAAAPVAQRRVARAVDPDGVRRAVPSGGAHGGARVGSVPSVARSPVPGVVGMGRVGGAGRAAARPDGCPVVDRVVRSRVVRSRVVRSRVDRAGRLDRGARPAVPAAAAIAVVVVVGRGDAVADLVAPAAAGPATGSGALAAAVPVLGAVAVDGWAAGVAAAQAVGRTG